MTNKTLLATIGLLSITSAFAQPPAFGNNPNMVTRQTIHSDVSGSTTITTVIEPVRQTQDATATFTPMAMPVVNTNPEAIMPKTEPSAAASFLAPSSTHQPATLDHEVVTHYHLGSQKAEKSMPAYQNPVNSNKQAPTVRYENMREDPEDVMMRILNQRQ
ncbi:MULTISPECIES: hypothetical protein [Vitreoscilla]|uniref:Uncharacterized protein n=1 Tax=Vitreoscilla stercoraria TaxID=61 RepID=A0ABY4EAQ5_VITST|nr:MULTISPECIES: hypothetical protein [Vitreoscilla]AUZ04235.2 hypothetical protein ADP71_04410 [Vitreoscilla sp. C1]UOO92010.1 hypothetical protein LVJ81_10300 [Vitreoscilla stercoraria]